MGRSRYLITEPDKPHFLTCTVLEWLPLFTRPALVEIVLDCWRYQQANQGLRLYGYVVLENHLHYVAQAPDLGNVLAGSSRSARAGSSITCRHAELNTCCSGCVLPSARTRTTVSTSSGRKARMPN